jgi:hypothetical protein
MDLGVGIPTMLQEPDLRAVANPILGRLPVDRARWPVLPARDGLAAILLKATEETVLRVKPRLVVVAYVAAKVR